MSEAFDSRLSWRLPCGRTASKFVPDEFVATALWHYWEHLIHDDQDFARHANYIHYNPVKHGYVERVADWPYSTFHREVERSVYALDWAGMGEVDLEAGERV